MTVAIVGSRAFPSRHTVEAYVADLPPETVVVSGGAAGVDTWAAEAADRRGLTVVVIRANWKLHGKAAGFKRNAMIVAQADQIVAFWDGVSRGTKHTIDLGVAAGKPVHTFLCRTVAP